MNQSGPEELEHLVSDLEDQLRDGFGGANPIAFLEYRRSALELLGNAFIAKETLRGLPNLNCLYVPKRMET
jgi:hypothetical protein